MTLAAGYSDITATSDVASGATITAGGGVEVESQMIKSSKVGSSAGAYDDGTVGIGVSVSILTADVVASVEGNISAAGNITIDAEGSTSFNVISASAAVGTSDLFNKVLGAFSSGAGAALQGFLSGPGLLSAITAKVGSTVGQTNNLAISGAFAVADQADTVQAEVGANAVDCFPLAAG